MFFRILNNAQFLFTASISIKKPKILNEFYTSADLNRICNGVRGAFFFNDGQSYFKMNK